MHRVELADAALGKQTPVAHIQLSGLLTLQKNHFLLSDRFARAWVLG